MARRPVVETPAPAEPPVQAVPDPILCSPYEKPEAHWIYQHGAPQVMGGRRAAGYYYTTERSGAAQTNLFEQGFDQLALVNALRSDVERWRGSGYRGASEVTKELLRHWRDPGRERRLFFCQVEAVETIIYLLEIRIPGRSSRTGFQSFELTDGDVQRLLKGEPPQQLAEAGSKRPPTLVDASSDPDLLALRRLGCKMATGSGKTVVMAMLIAWAFCNRHRNPQTRDFPNAALVCAPNLTVKNRLVVLRPEDPTNYYEQFNLVPVKYLEAVRAGKVLVTNWHVFAAKSPNAEGGVSYRVVDKGEEDNRAFTLARLGELSQRLPLLVLNDEGHHCWRPKQTDEIDDVDLSTEERATLKDEMNEARVWLDGLDRINSSGLAGKDANGQPIPAVLATIDLSATPFYLAGSGYPEGSPFPWLVSDFGLVDAIESGIVKIPRIPVKHLDAQGEEVGGGPGQPDPEFYRLWDHAVARMNASDRMGRNRYKPEAVFREVQNALVTLYSQWKAQFNKYEEAVRNQTQEVIPPVMIVVCPDTEVARYFYERLSGERIDGEGKEVKRTWEATNFPEFSNGTGTTEGKLHTVRIDSELLKALAGDEEASKDDKIRQMREIIDTIGKPGRPGGLVRCVVSVSMLTEGWDANNVTQILGVRPFRSQLLCEQVVGRGLRRRSYLTEESGKLGAEHVDVYGIPFSLIPFKGAETDKEPKPDVPPNRVYAMPDRAQYAVEVPNVSGFRYKLNSSGVMCDFDRIQPMGLHQEPAGVLVEGIRGYRLDSEMGQGESGDKVRQDASEYLAHVHLNSVAMTLAMKVLERLDTQQSKLPELSRVAMTGKLFQDVFGIVNRFINEKIQLRPGEDIRTLGYDRNLSVATERLVAGIQAGFTGPIEERLLPRIHTFRSALKSGDVSETTRRRVYKIVKSHVNAFAYRSDTEIRIADALDWSPLVKAWLPNVRGGFDFRIAYEYAAATYDYEPDFIVRLTVPEGEPAKYLLLEVKGGGGEVWDPERTRAKDAAALKWRSAVNNHGGFGHWEFLKAYSVEEVDSKLAQMAGCSVEKWPFMVVHPSKSDRWKGCVPKMPFAVAAGAFLNFGAAAETEESLFADDTVDWISWEGMPQVSKGWFVCRVNGTSMAPVIPEHAWCLFRPFSGYPEGKLLLVSHQDIHELGQPVGMTLKRFWSELIPGADGSSERVRVTLEPLNTNGHEPIVIDKSGESQVRVVAEFVKVLA